MPFSRRFILFSDTMQQSVHLLYTVCCMQLIRSWLLLPK